MAAGSLCRLAYVVKLAGAGFLRFALTAAIKLVKPSQAESDPAPEPYTKVLVPRTETKEAHVHPIRCDVYIPRHLRQQSAGDSDSGRQGGASATTATVAVSEYATLPVIINMHGSGFVFYAMGDDACFCQEMADRVGAVVVDVDYSKAPEKAYPHASHDLDAVLAYVKGGGGGGPAATGTAANAASDSSQSLQEVVARLPAGKHSLRGGCVALTGFSAGGNLVLTACVRAQEKGRLQDVRAVASFYPSSNLAESPYLKPNVRPDKGAAGGVLPPVVRRFLYWCYIPQAEGFPARNSRHVSPLYADATAFPPSVTIVTCSGDSLAREGRQMAEHIVQGRIGESGGKDGEGHKAGGAAMADPPAQVADVLRAPVQHGVEEHGVLWWEAKGQGHAWDKMAPKGSEAGKLVAEAYELVAVRLREALRSSPSKG